MHTPRALIAAILATTLLLSVPASMHAQGVRGPFTVVKVVDGDTIDVLTDGGVERVRLIGVDCPELHHSDPVIKMYGKLSTEFTEKRLMDSEVWLEADAQPTDQFGRTLAYVWTIPPPANAADEQLRTSMFNGVLLYEGWAMVFTVPPNVKYSDVLVAFQRDAIENMRGLWKDPNLVIDPYGIVYRTETGTKYHLRGCSYLSESCIEIIRLEAFLRGLGPCSVCSPAPLTAQP